MYQDFWQALLGARRKDVYRKPMSIISIYSAVFSSFNVKIFQIFFTSGSGRFLETHVPED